MRTDFRITILLTMMCCWVLTPAKGSEANLTKLATQTLAQLPAQAGMSLYVIDGEQGYSFVHGNADLKGTKLTPEHTFRIASVTKTYTAATLLRLLEQGKLKLEDPINKLISKSIDNLLTSDGYQTDKITVQQLLSHTAGLNDHAQTEKYLNSAVTDPLQIWTPEQQIKACVEWAEPVGNPGEQFFYSDTGYVILGHIIERTANTALPLAVRTLLHFENNRLIHTYWELGDITLQPQPTRAHQYFQSQDIYHWHPSMDLFGGGGLVASPGDMAKFYQALFSAKIFEKPNTLSIMLSSENLPEKSPYRLGLFIKDINGNKVYEHGGFWGTSVMYEPTNGLVIAGAVTRAEDYKSLTKIMTGFIRTKLLSDK